MKRAAHPGQPATVHQLRCTTEWVTPTHAVMTVLGDIDAANADAFLDGVLMKVLLCHSLELDLSDVEFFSSAGYSALCILAERCVAAEVALSVTPSRCVRRVMDSAVRQPLSPLLDRTD
ncbi:anti-anti-sigma regulatory factor (antagonist of anti-sigma factor) [Mycolicibacterium tokaiense]|uniref:Anti-anti-sigma regulatory factor (Antagonist of anti-sigma factor) n=2 Tax=Mycolicibacterium tokaiense TaxID=39695 RepID=A0A378T859_9MYCO|nr:anti-anti-sigma regulatory factor (antagonist of anti-sigma factor) [Mycolicibacterium tokaiense]